MVHVSDRFDLAVVGGGIVGLATARALLAERPDLRLVILEKEARLASHQTGHNSGVIHSGIYYKPGSHKARLCVEGARLMKDFCAQHGIRVDPIGKVIVATSEAELPRLQTLFERGTANGVPGLRLIDRDDLREIEPHAAAIRAIHSPTTAIVDYGEVAQAIARELLDAGRRHPDGRPGHRDPADGRGIRPGDRIGPRPGAPARQLRRASTPTSSRGWPAPARASGSSRSGASTT